MFVSKGADNTKLHIALFILILFAAVWLRLPACEVLELTYQERLMYDQCRAGEIWRASDYQTTTPFFIFMAHRWMQVAGDGVVGTKGIPFLSGIAAVILMYGLSRRVMSRTGALISMGLLCFLPYHVHISRHMLPYSMMVCLWLWQLYCFGILLKRGSSRKRVCGFIIAGICAVLLHGSSLIVIVCEYVYLMMIGYDQSRTPKRLWNRYFLWIAAVGVTGFSLSFLYSNPDISLHPDGMSIVTICYVLFLDPLASDYSYPVLRLFALLLTGVSVFTFYKAIISFTLTAKKGPIRGRFRIESPLRLIFLLILICFLIVPSIISIILPHIYDSNIQVTGVMTSFIVLATSGLLQIRQRMIRIVLIILIAGALTASLTNYMWFRAGAETIYIMEK